MTSTHDLIQRRAGSFRTFVLAAVVMVGLTMPPSEAQACELCGDYTPLVVVGGILVASVGGLFVYDCFDFGSDSQPSSWNATWDFIFGVPLLWVAADPGIISGSGFEVRLPALVMGGVMAGHGIWEINRMRESDSSPSEATDQPATSMSLTPVLLNREGDMGLGFVGRF